MKTNAPKALPALDFNVSRAAQMFIRSMTATMASFVNRSITALFETRMASEAWLEHANRASATQHHPKNNVLLKKDVSTSHPPPVPVFPAAPMALPEECTTMIARPEMALSIAATPWA